MISEGSWDTEDWSNDAENSALHQRHKLHFAIYSQKKKIILNNNISQYYCFIYQINAVLVSIRDIFQKHKKTHWPRLLNSSVDCIEISG